MRMYKLKISPEAVNDLSEIKSYISQELCNPQAAIKLVSKIMVKIRRLSEYPQIGAPLTHVVDIQTDYRFLVCANYLIFYRCEGEDIFVSRIVYGRRDHMRVLFREQLEDEEK